MAKYNRYGMMSEAYVTDTVTPEGNYQLYTKRGMGKFPKVDEDSVENHMEQVFAVKFDTAKFHEVNCIHRANGYPLGRYYFSWYNVGVLEKPFLVGLYEAFKEANFNVTIKARGRCHRRGKRAWEFNTVEYLIYVEKNAVLLKLMGLDTFVNKAWAYLDEKIQPLPVEETDEDASANG